MVRMACWPSRQLMPGAFQPLWGERLARRFDHAAPHGKPSRLITGVVHTVPLVLEVRALGVEQFAPLLASLPTHFRDNREISALTASAPQVGLGE